MKQNTFSAPHNLSNNDVINDGFIRQNNKSHKHLSITEDLIPLRLKEMRINGNCFSSIKTLSEEMKLPLDLSEISSEEDLKIAAEHIAEELTKKFSSSKKTQRVKPINSGTFYQMLIRSFLQGQKHKFKNLFFIEEYELAFILIS